MNGDRIKILLLVGATDAVTNILLKILLVEVFKFNTYFLKPLVNILAIEMSIV